MVSADSAKPRGFSLGSSWRPRGETNNFHDQMRFPTTSLHVRVSTSPTFSTLESSALTHEGNSARVLPLSVATLPKRLDPYEGLILVSNCVGDFGMEMVFTNYRTS